MESYTITRKLEELPRIPFEGFLDVTYRCNNNCRHCWLRLPLNAPEKEDELSFDEIVRIVDEARKMGCTKWFISGGEPMIRPDFADILDYITRKSSSYALNTNGTLITPKIAQIMKRRGSKMISIYGATAEVHDHITRNPGSFEATMRGIAYLKEAGAGFIVQIVPMRDNYHQIKDMLELGRSLSNNVRYGASWLYLSACRDPKRNQEIIAQRLSPKEIIEIDPPYCYFDGEDVSNSEHPYSVDDEFFFASCIKNRRDFHVDPYGMMSFCCFVKDPELRYNLRTGSFQEAWDEFIPSLATKISVNDEYNQNCRRCELRSECHWCPVYALLEHGRYSAKINYLCDLSKETKLYKDNWRKEHIRHFKIAEITLRVESDLPISDSTFSSKLRKFEVAKPNGDLVTIRHHFSLPRLNMKDLGKEVYRKPPWAIYKKGDSWVYLGILPDSDPNEYISVIIFNGDHTKAEIYNDDSKAFLKGNLESLTMMPTDQILIARLLADREGFYVHSSGVSLDGKGLLFVGHSTAGKSTMVKMLMGRAEVLCDDRIIVRRHNEGFKIHGTWSHGEVSEISPNSAPLRAILFLEKSSENELILVDDKKWVLSKMLACIIKPLLTSDWWEKTLSTLEKVIQEVPAYRMYFDKSGKIVDLLEKL